MPRTVAGLAELTTLLGQEVGVSDWLPVPQSLIATFAEATQDRQWLHVDTERARRESPYGTTIAHGFLTLSLISHLHHQAVVLDEPCSRVINYGLNRVRFPAPVLAGAHVRGHSTLQGLADVDGGVQLTWLITVEVEGQAKPAVVAEWLVRLYR